MASSFIIMATVPAIAQETGELPNISTESISTDISQLDGEILAAETDAASYEGGLVKSLAVAHVETLKLTQAILQNRLEAERGGATIEVSVPVAVPDPLRATELLEEIEAQTSVVMQAEIEAANGGGLVGALAQSRLQTEKLTLATLRAAWFRARYGAMLPLPLVSSPSTPEPNATETAQVGPALQNTPAWADPKHPEIDYSRPIFQQLSSEGFEMSGWWAVLETQAEIDDSRKVLAINFSAYQDGFQASNPRLLVQCSEGATSVIYDADDYLLTDVRSDTIAVTYRIDDYDAVTDRWSKLTSSKGAGVFNNLGQEMVRKLYDAERIFTRIVERDNERHDATFELAGAQIAFDAVASACGFSTLSLSNDDYRSIQTMLNTAGFDTGIPDGVWGAGSAAAMRAYQAAESLLETGAPDRATLRHMGLEF